ncbi:hypothetical protein AOLI_G00081540 [Acnodon oligacanthus]
MLQCCLTASGEVLVAHNATLGSDVTLSCVQSGQAKSSTPHWEKEGAPTSNTSLFLNNTAYIVLHSVDKQSQGTYTCKNETHQVQHFLYDSENTYKAAHALYRADFSSSEVSLICRSKNRYPTVTWTLKQSHQNRKIHVLTAKRGEQKSHGRFLSEVYDGFFFLLHIKYVEFNDSGEYSCYVNNDSNVFTTIWLRTLKVSAEPPDGVFRNQSVVLTCEVSEVTVGVTLAWLRMEGNTAVLVKQDVLTDSKRTLSVTLKSFSEDQLLWQCALFTENTPRAVAPIKLCLLPESWTKPCMTTKPTTADESDAISCQHDKLKISAFIQPAGNTPKAQHGTDVTLSCVVASLPESYTLQWEREGAPTSNTTLFLNNTAYIILHSVDQQSQGTYTCKLKQNGKDLMCLSETVSVSEYTYATKSFALYRETSNSSDLALICKSDKSYDRIKWQINHPELTMIAAEKGKNTVVNGPIEPGKRTTTSYNGHEFILHVSPVRFNYSGTYKCVGDDKTNYSTVRLHTVRVSAEPPGALRNQSVVLTCEVSEGADRVTLAWLRMEGNRAVLVKQDALTGSKRTLNVTLKSLSEGQLLWQCALFNESTLRALAPIKLRLLSTFTETPQSGDRVVEGSILHTVIIAACAVAACVVILLGALLFYFQRKSAADGGHVAMAKAEEEEEELHYATVTVLGVCDGAGGNPGKNAPGTSDSTIYSTVNFN